MGDEISALLGLDEENKRPMIMVRADDVHSAQAWVTRSWGTTPLVCVAEQERGGVVDDAEVREDVEQLRKMADTIDLRGDLGLVVDRMIGSAGRPFTARMALINGKPVMTIDENNRVKAHSVLRRAFGDGVGISLIIRPSGEPEEEEFTTERGNVLRREPTRVERELAEAVLHAFVHEGMTVDVDLFALQLSNILVNVCDYTPGEQTVAQLQEGAALTGTPWSAEQGIQAFVAALKRYWGTNVSTHWVGDAAIDDLTRAALKGETR